MPQTNRRAFIELKREVARKAAFSRTDKPIPDKMIEEWEVKEIAKNREVSLIFSFEIFNNFFSCKRFVSKT